MANTKKLLSMKILRLRKLVTVLISFLFLVYIVLIIDLSQLPNYLTAFEFSDLLFITIVIVFILFIRAWRWSYLMQGTVSFDTKTLYLFSLQSQFINSFMPNGSGDVLKVFFAQTMTEDDILPELTTLTLVDRLLDVIIILGGAILAVFLLEDFSVELIVLLMFVGVLFSCFTIGILFLLQLPQKCLIKYPRIRKQFILLFKFRFQILISFVVTTIAWILEGIKLFLILKALDINISLFVALQIAVAAWGGSILLIFISGTLGTKEYFISYWLQQKNANPSVSGFSSIVDRVFTIFVSFCFYTAFFILHKFYWKNKRVEVKSISN